MIQNFSARVSTWLLTWPYSNSRFLSFKGPVSWLLPGVVHGGPALVMAEADFHSQLGDLLGYDQKHFVHLLQLVVVPCASVLIFAFSFNRTRQDPLRELKAH